MTRPVEPPVLRGGGAVEVLRTLIEEIEAILPYVREADMLAWIHGHVYDGPEGGIPAALDKARSFLKENEVGET
jgi:hypothetical protein